MHLEPDGQTLHSMAGVGAPQHLGHFPNPNPNPNPNRNRNRNPNPNPNPYPNPNPNPNQACRGRRDVQSGAQPAPGPRRLGQ